MKVVDKHDFIRAVKEILEDVPLCLHGGFIEELCKSTDEVYGEIYAEGWNKCLEKSREVLAKKQAENLPDEIEPYEVEYNG